MGLVFYNPTEEQCQKVEGYVQSGIFSKIIICDNSENALNRKFPECVKYHYMGYNSGLSIPYNKFIEVTADDNADVLCIMDQDSDFRIDEIKKIVNYIEENTDALNDVALVCPRTINSQHIDKIDSLSVEKEYVGWTINSGSFLILENIKKKNLSYDENVFLDGVDYDFCYNIKSKNLHILRYNGALLIQPFGYSKKEKGGFDHHSASRYYNIAHNRKYIFRKYHGIKGFIFAILVNTRLAFRILFHEDNRVEKVIACLKGTFK